MATLRRTCPYCRYQLGNGSADAPWQCSKGLTKVTIVRPCDEFKAKPELWIGEEPVEPLGPWCKP